MICESIKLPISGPRPGETRVSRIKARRVDNTAIKPEFFALGGLVRPEGVVERRASCYDDFRKAELLENSFGDLSAYGHARGSFGDGAQEPQRAVGDRKFAIFIFNLRAKANYDCRNSKILDPIGKVAKIGPRVDPVRSWNNESIEPFADGLGIEIEADVLLIAVKLAPNRVRKEEISSVEADSLIEVFEAEVSPHGDFGIN